MGIWIFYLIALIPVSIGGILWLRDSEITWAEWLGGSAIGFALALIFQFLSVAGMTHDIETWSGYINKAIHWPRWVEEYQQAHTQTYVDSKGNSYTTTYYTTEYRTHPEHWTAYTTIPDEHEIDQPFFAEITRNFGGSITTETPWKTGFYSGDRHSYVAYKHTDYVYPVTALKWWSNRVKAAPTLFSFSKVPTNIAVFEWPENSDWLHSERLKGTAVGMIDLLEFDRMNSRLGERKHVNVIMVGCGHRDISFAEWQRAKWIGGKKNDLVICYGDGWARVFGWSDSEICKRNLETIVLKNKVSTETLPLIESEIIKGYTPKNWHSFDYIRIEPPSWSYWIYGLVLMASQIGFYIWAKQNTFSK